MNFAVQIIVTQELPQESQHWITLLHGDLSREEAKRAIQQANQLSDKAEKEYADSVLQVVLSENREIFDLVKKEEREMCEALRELMAPEIREAEKKAMERGMEKGMEKGMQKGIEKGMEKGHTVGRQEGLSEGLSVGRKEERTANIQRTIARLQRMNESTKEILAALMDIFQLSEMEAKSYLK